MDGFLIKPLDRDKLAEALAGLGGLTAYRGVSLVCTYSRRSATVSTT